MTVKTKAKTAEKKTAPKAKAVVAPDAPLYVIGVLPPVRPGSHRAYAQEIARSLAKSNKKGFTLAAFRAELVAQGEASTIAPPTTGWKAHNFPTWMSHANQGWLVLAK